MPRPTAVIVQRDGNASAAIAFSLCRHCGAVQLVSSHRELREAIPRHAASIVVADLESVDFGEVESLHRDFDGVTIVCTHRLADELLWAAALRCGALDCCYPTDCPGIVAALEHRARPRPRPRAA